MQRKSEKESETVSHLRPALNPWDCPTFSKWICELLFLQWLKFFTPLFSFLSWQMFHKIQLRFNSQNGMSWEKDLRVRSPHCCIGDKKQKLPTSVHRPTVTANSAMKKETFKLSYKFRTEPLWVVQWPLVLTSILPESKAFPFLPRRWSSISKGSYSLASYCFIPGKAISQHLFLPLKQANELVRTQRNSC